MCCNQMTLVSSKHADALEKVSCFYIAGCGFDTADSLSFYETRLYNATLSCYHDTPIGLRNFTWIRRTSN